MSEVVMRCAHPDERTRVIDFINENFDWKLPLVNLPEYFEYYYCGKTLQYVLAEQNGELLAAAGYILANQSETPDIWVSVWVAKKGHNGIGLELMDTLPGLLHARVVACNNIRPKTCVFYRFLGWTAERMPHYFRLSGQNEYRLCRPADTELLPAAGDLCLEPVNNPGQLDALGMPPCPHTPAKDTWYMKRRYFAFPHLSYRVWCVRENGALLAYLVTRTVQSGEQGEIPVLRLVDFVGCDEVLPRLGKAIDALLHSENAEYAECYNAGIPAEVWAKAGFRERREGDGNIIPNYLTPPLYDNTEYYYFTNRPEGFTMFKADGDQDRPNLTVE